MATYRADYTEQEKRAFAQRLKKLILEAGWTGAETARQVSKHREGDMPRQLISQYTNGQTVPDEVNLRALAKAFKVPQTYLLSRPHNLAPGEVDTTPPATLQDMRSRVIEGGMMELIFSGTVPRPIGRQIQKLLDEADEEMTKRRETDHH